MISQPIKGLTMTAIALESGLQCRTVTNTPSPNGVSSTLTTSFWEEMTPTNECDPFFGAQQIVEPTLDETAASIWA